MPEKHSLLLSRLKDRLGAGHILTDPDRTAAYVIDERRLFHGRPLAVVRPADTTDVSFVLSGCSDSGTAVVPHGGNTGYCGGATCDASGMQLVLSLERLNRVRSVDAPAGAFTLEAGVTLADAQQAAESAGMLFPMNMGSRNSCQIGGNLSTNAGGLAVLRYGTMRDLTLGLEVVLPDGRVIDGLRTLRKDTTGYDLKQLFIGAEGTLGVITAASLKLFPRPDHAITMLAGVRDLRQAFDVLVGLRRLVGDNVTSFEYIAPESKRYVLNAFSDLNCPLDERCEHMVLAECAAFEDRTAQVLEETIADFLVDDETGVEEVVLARSEQQRRELWRLRELIPAAEKTLGGSIKHDVSVTLSSIADFVDRARDAIAARWPAARLSVYGHVGDGNVHFNVLAPASEEPIAFRETEGSAVSEAIHGLAASMNGSFSAEHGVGMLKRDLLERYKTGTEYAVMRALKQVVDPQSIMNPGKLV